MAKYRKKPVVIEAIKWDGNDETLKQIKDWNCQAPSGVHTGGIVQRWREDSLRIHTLEGAMEASLGDMIIKGVNGEVYPCKPDIFEKTYDAVEGD